ncbi:cupredoxin domain-containing protein [Thermomonas sp.]|uniref:cupredoxin domain-containing protein n=1 Tax=Thermomonas sp. TaxID=1971895 RepID=UPI00248A03A8|nr:cupredoxin domain-containing protein [Thermomonas sp.]MDI1252980.1 cupredoxin domain-containing protein [Thermomonas sp.]
MCRLIPTCLALLGLALGAPAASAADQYEASLVIQGHRFQPAELVVPAGRKIKLTVVNRDATAEEFESYELNREKVVAGGSSIVVYIGPLRPGTYPFFGEFHMETAKGKIIAE